MILKNTRRDVGYTIISRFEEDFRYFLSNHLGNMYEDFIEGIPVGIVSKATEQRQYNTIFQDTQEFFENTDFPDLKEICLFKDHYNRIISSRIEKFDFQRLMDELYLLRCKIAHIKGYFTSLDLDKLIDFTSQLATKLDFSNFITIIEIIKKDPASVVIKIPIDFIQDQFSISGIINNIPIPDYDYEGGFVGRDEDIKKIIQLLQSDKFSVITLTGSGGVGKTSLALKILQEINEKKIKMSFDAIIWLSAKEDKLTAFGIEDIEPTLRNYDEFLNTIIDLFNFREELHNDSVEDKEALVNFIISCQEKILIVVDNLETITDQRIINFIFEAPLKVKFLITSRRGIGQVERRYELKEMSKKEAVYLFRQVAKDKQLSKLSTLSDDVINNYVGKVSYYPLAIKWVVGQVARGKDINKVIDLIGTSDSDISKFCYEQIFSSLTPVCKNIIFTISLLSNNPTSSIIEYVLNIEDQEFEDAIYELMLTSLVIPEQFQNDKKEIATKYLLLPLTKGYTRVQLNKNVELREQLNKRINEVENTVTESDRAKKEYKHSLYNFGAITDEEKIASIIAQTAFQKYQSGFYDAAVEEYKRAIKTAPNFAPIYRNWATMESYEGHISEAEKLMERASVLNSNDPQIFLIWGNIYRKCSRHNDAYKKYLIAYNLSPEDPIVLNAFGQAKSRLGEFKEAHELLNKALVPNSEFASQKHEIINRTSIAENLINWGDSLVRDRNFGEAQLKYNAAIKECLLLNLSNSKDAGIFSTLSKAYLKIGLLYLNHKNESDTQIAIEFFNKIIEIKNINFKQSLFRLSAIVELLEINFKVDDSYKIDQLFKIIEKDYFNSPILKRVEYKQLQERIIRIKEFMINNARIKGKIKSINTSKGFVILADSEKLENTYFGHANSFLPRLDIVGPELIGRTVSFVHVHNEKFKREEAVKIKIHKE